MARCPDCSGLLTSGGICMSCGHGKTAAGGKTIDPDWWRCADMKFGARCSKPGGIAHGTQGGGPWYCRDHIQGASKSGGATPPPGGFKALRDVMVDPEYAKERAAIEGA